MTSLLQEAEVSRLTREDQVSQGGSDKGFLWLAQKNDVA